jgi:hypothetical protein
MENETLPKSSRFAPGLRRWGAGPGAAPGLINQPQ